MNVIKEITSENMTLIKVIVIKETDNGNKFASLGEIMTLEESTANVLIRKGLVKVYDEKLKADLEKKSEEVILAEAMKAEVIKAETSKKEYTVTETVTNSEPVKVIKKTAGRPKKK